VNRFDRERLRDTRRSGVAEKPTPHWVLGVARDEDDSLHQIRPRPLQFLVEAAAVEDGHLQITHDQIVGPFLKLSEGHGTVGDSVHGVPVKAEHVGEQGCNQGSVLDDEDALASKRLVAALRAECRAHQKTRSKRHTRSESARDYGV